MNKPGNPPRETVGHSIGEEKIVKPRLEDPKHSLRQDTYETVEFRNVWLSFRNHAVLRGITIGVDHGETLCLLGGSGVGKSSILRLILGLILPDDGEVIVEGQDITNVSRENLLK